VVFTAEGRTGVALFEHTKQGKSTDQTPQSGIAQQTSLGKAGGFISEPLKAVWFTKPTSLLSPSKELLHQL
jgi:hypothetical protein